MRWYLFVVLICLSLMINDVEHLCLYLLAIYISSLEKYPFRSSAHFLTRLFGLFVFCYWVLWVLYIIWILAPHQIFDLQIFPLSQKVAFSFWLWFPELCTDFSLIQSHFTSLHFMAKRRSNRGSSDRFYFLRLQNHWGQWLQPWNKDVCSLEGTLWQT